MTDRKLVLVDWVDILTDHGWESTSQTPTVPSPIQSIGWIIADTPDFLVLASDLATTPDDKETNRRSAIPKGTIKKITDITIRKPRGKNSNPRVLPRRTRPVDVPWVESDTGVDSIMDPKSDVDT